MSEGDLRHLAESIGAALRTIVTEETRSALEVVAKQTEVAGDVVTAADLGAQARIYDLLMQLLPASTFIGEEGFESRDAIGAGYAWIVDPLDGTLNFACDIPFFGASVALVKEGDVVLGVVYDASSDTVFDASVDGPARCNGQTFIWDGEKAGRAPVGISSGFLALMQADPDRYRPDWLSERFRIFGSQAVQLCWAAAGRLRLNINKEAKLWDDAAGALICKQAGAGYDALASSPLFPLSDHSDALAGKSLFSVSGSPDLVAMCKIQFSQES